MGNEADNAAAQIPDRRTAARTATAEPQPDGSSAGHTPPAERFSLLAELAKDPANGLKEIQPGWYVCRKHSTAPDR
jgi:hypothetical protein